MKKSSILFPGITALLVLILLYSCSNDVSPTSSINHIDSCGIVAHVNHSWEGPSFQGYRPSTFTLASERYFEFYILVDSICTKDGDNFGALCTADFVNHPERPIRFYEEITWSVFFALADSGHFVGNTSWTGSIQNLGFVQQFGSGPANCAVSIVAHFHTLGSYAQDSVFLSQNFTHFFVTTAFLYYKPSGASAPMGNYQPFYLKNSFTELNTFFEGVVNKKNTQNCNIPLPAGLKYE